ncbi:PREDICTED: uncharacterized protein LOC108364624, partial [Rhagoletis zephyria]|uniref:uncharacterized protein LOC108364624 n=1 Tax=Rhagoletis zephyria TaxID=28612 RepID=UPI0008117C29
MPLGDRKPSELFSEMKRVAGTTLNDSLLHDLWVARLPPYVQAAIIATKVPLTEKVKVADSIAESIGWYKGQVEMVSSSRNDIANLKDEIAELSRNLQRQFKVRDRPRARSLSRSKTVPQNSTSKNGFCLYHNKFGDKATKCREP